MKNKIIITIINIKKNKTTEKHIKASMSRRKQESALSSLCLLFVNFILMSEYITISGGWGRGGGGCRPFSAFSCKKSAF